jgi:hypothetical protein
VSGSNAPARKQSKEQKMQTAKHTKKIKKLEAKRAKIDKKLIKAKRKFLGLSNGGGYI